MRTTPNFDHGARRKNWRPSAGFTLVEVMAVVAIILVVVALLSAALNQTRIRTMRVLCLDNMKQLQIAWQIYADDHNDYIALNRTVPVVGTSGTVAAMASSTNSWVAGNPKLDKGTDNIKKGALYPIVKHPEVYRCPLDNSTTRYGTMRSRSYSINSYLGGDDDDLDPRVKMKTTELVNPPPDQVFVFIEEHEDSVWSGGFLVLPRDRTPGSTGNWNSTPSDRHMQGCNLTFADGHLEYWKWLAPKKPTKNQLINDPKDLRDLRRLQESLPKP